MPKPKKPKEYEDLGRTVAAIYETGYLDKKQMLKMSFLKGMASGLGGVLGATIVVALLLWVLSLLGEIPFAARITESIRDTIRSN